jgi:hypothetical protein
METITSNDQRYISVAAGEVLLPMSIYVSDMVDSVQFNLTRAQHDLIIKDAGFELPPGLTDNDVLPMAMGLVQNEWYRATRGEVPAQVLKNHDERTAKLHKRIEEVKLHPPAPEPVKEAKAAKTPREPKEPRMKEPARTCTYQVLSDAVKTSKSLAPFLDMKNLAKGHDGIIIQELERIGAAVTLDELVKEVEAIKRYETNDPLAKSVRWHLNKLAEKGYIKVTEVSPSKQ